MEEKRINKIEKMIAGGRGKHLLQKALTGAIIAVFVLLFLRVINLIGLVNWKVSDTEEIIAIILGAAFAGFMNGFDSWIRLLEEHDKHSDSKATRELSGLEPKS